MRRFGVVKQKNTVIGSRGAQTKNDCAGEASSKLPDQTRQHHTTPDQIRDVSAADLFPSSAWQINYSMVVNCNTCWAVVALYVGQRASLIKLAYTQVIVSQVILSADISYKNFVFMCVTRLVYIHFLNLTILGEEQAYIS
jgi:hypothetical protein